MTWLRLSSRHSTLLARVASSVTDNFGNRDNLEQGSAGARERVRVASSCGVEGVLRRCLSPRLLKLSRLSVTSFRVGCSARQTLRPPQRALAAIPKRSLVICTPPEARGSILRDCNHLWRVGPPHRDTGANKGSICRYNMLDFLLKASPLRARERGPFTQVVHGPCCRATPKG